MINLKEIHLDKYKQLGLKIADYRKLKGYSQESLADALQKSPIFIAQVEAPNMDRAISLDTLFDIADLLDVPAYKFLYFD